MFLLVLDFELRGNLQNSIHICRMLYLPVFLLRVGLLTVM